MTSMREVPYMTSQEVTIGTRHRETLLKLSFWHQKSGSKRSGELYFTTLYVWINVLRWSDPELGTGCDRTYPGE
jgi:hypothetical protein